MEREARLRVGMIGAGLVAQAVHLPVLQRLDRHFAVAALAEPDAAVRARVATRHGIDRAYPDHRLLLEAGGLDVILVCSPDATHAQVTLDALHAGLHVLVEKPLCLTPADAAEIIAARDRAGRVVQVGYMKRFDPAVERLLADLHEPPRHVATATFDPGLRAAFVPDGAPEEPPSRRAALLGAPVHDVNLVHAVLERTGTAVETVVDAFGDGGTVGATFALRGGARWTAVWLSLPAAGTFREHVAVYGDGVQELEFPAPYLLHAPTTYRWTRGSGAVVQRSWNEAYARQLLHLHACVTRGEPCRTPPEQAVTDLELLGRCEP